MVTAKKRPIALAFDVKKLSEELGASVKLGTVSAVRGRYFVKVGATKKEVVVGDTNPAAEVKALVGPVAVVVSGRTIVAVGKPPRRPWIICYIPVPDLIRQVRPELRTALLKQYVSKGVIPDKAISGLARFG